MATLFAQGEEGALHAVNGLDRVIRGTWTSIWHCWNTSAPALHARGASRDITEGRDGT